MNFRIRKFFWALLAALRRQIYVNSWRCTGVTHAPKQRFTRIRDTVKLLSIECLFAQTASVTHPALAQIATSGRSEHLHRVSKWCCLSLAQLGLEFALRFGHQA